MWLVVGLGNPGSRYRRTRHNVGFRVVDRLAARWGVEVSREVHRALVGEWRSPGARVILVKPQTLMNASGDAVGSLRRYHPVDVGHVVAVHDDVDLPLGRLRLRRGGGPGGHRGLTSLIDVLSDQDFVRIRVGVGRPPAGWDTSDYVLAAPSAVEEQALGEAEERAADAVELVLADGLERAMNRMNKRETVHGGPSL